jgi:hypothetical protein
MAAWRSWRLPNKLFVSRCTVIFVLVCFSFHLFYFTEAHHGFVMLTLIFYSGQISDVFSFLWNV